MIHLANILIADADAASAQELLRKVRSHGYDGRTVTSVEAVLSTVQQELPDIILVCSHLNGGDAFATAVALRAIPSCADIPICLLSDVRTADFRTRALDAGLDDSLAPPLDEGKLVARLRPLVRLSIMQAELRRHCPQLRRRGFGRHYPSGHRLRLFGAAGGTFGHRSGSGPDRGQDQPGRRPFCRQ